MKEEISSLLPNAETLPGSQTEANPASASPSAGGTQATQEPDWETFYAQLKARQKLDAQAERDRDLDRFARSPECGENEATFDYLDTYCERSFGIRPNRGNYFNTDLGEDTALKPFASAERYLNALMLIKRHGYEAIASDRYRAVTKAEATGDLRELARTLGVPTEKIVAKSDGAHAFFDPGMTEGLGNAIEARTDEEIEEDVKDALARVKGENFIAMMGAVGYDFDDDDKALLQAALAKGDGMPAEFEPHLASVFRESPEKAARLAAMVDRTRKVESDWLRDVVWRPLWTDGIWRAAKNQASAITDSATPAINFSAFNEIVKGSSDSAKYYWNDDERAEYARLLGLARTRQTQVQEKGLTAPMFGVYTSSVTPMNEEEAKRRVDDMCVRRLAREALPRDEQIRRRREQLLLEDAVGYRQTYEYSYANRAIAGALSSVGYMATSSVGMGAGFTLNTLAQFQSIRDDMIRDGLDPDAAIGAQIFSATVWSAVEKAQFSTAFGKPLTGLQRKVMAMRIASANGAMSKFAAIGALARAGSKELLVSTITESIEEGLQGGVEGFTRSALWTGDYRKAFADAVRQAGSDFVESLGSMALIAGSGTGWKAVTSNRQAQSYESLADFAAKRRRAVNAVTGKTYASDEAIPKEAQHALNDVKETLKRHGGDITSALDELRERIGLDEKGIREVGDYLDLQAALVEVARQEKDAKTALRIADFAGNPFPVGAPGSRLDAQALYDLVLPGTKVEDVEIPDTSAAPAAPVETPELSAAREAVAAAKAEVDAAKVGSARRGAEKKLRKAMKRLEKADAAAADAAPKPTRKVQKVTLPTGESYILERDTSAPDVHTSSWAQSVAQAMEESFADPALGEGQKPTVDGRDLSLDAFKAIPSLDKLSVAVTTEQYLAMTRDERESYCRHWGLAEGGHTRILDESGRELLGADGLVTIKDGFRSFVHRGGNWELAHEHGHFISAVAAKRMTPEQIATMRRLFGDPTAANERWNEENANNQFAEWLRGKYDFKVSTRAERRAKMNWFQRALDTVKHIFWLSGERPPVAPVEREMREKALDAAFNALRSGDFSGLDVYAGIDFAEDHAGNDGKDAAPDARKPTATASEEKAVNHAPKSEKGDTEAPKPVSKSPAPNPAAKPTSKSPEGGGATAASADFQAGYDAAVAAMNANPGAFADGQPVRTGGKMTVFTPDYSMKVEAEAMWTPLASLVESTDDREVQMRDRTRAATDEQTHSKTRPGVFQPLALFPGSKSDDGAPIVGGGNRIISGHGRKRMLDILAKEGRFSEYLDAVAAEAAKRGFAPPPDGMENPVLVLRVTGGLDKREDLVRFAELSNRWGGLERSGAEFAESDARKITDALLRLYAPDASGNLLAASNRPFMAAFLKAVGATGLTNADGTPTPEAALRVQRALMTAIFGNDEKIRSMVQSLLERSQELSLASLQNALMRSAGRLLAMKRQKGSFDIVSDVREAAYQYIAWRVAQQKSPKLTLAEHLRQGDFFAAEVPPMQQALARLLDAERFGKVLEKYNDLVSQQAVDAQSTFGFFEAKTPLQLLGEAERALLAEGETPVTPDPASPEAAAPAQTPPAVQAEPEQTTEDKPAPTPEAKPADPVEAAQAEIAPPEPATFVPVPAVRGTATLPGPGAEGVKAHQVNADGIPTTAVRTLPPGAWNLLRAPYDVRRPPKPSAQDRAGRGLGISAPPPATDSQGRNWGKVFPHFQDNKAEMADRTSQAIRRTMTKAERDHYTTVVDYFGGGGCWGLYHALTNFENARQLVVNEFDPDRLEKIRLLHEIDGQVADEAEAVLLDPKTQDEIRALANNSSAPVTIANKVEGAIKRRVSDGRVRAVLQAFIDCAHTMLGSVTDEHGNPVNDTEAGVRKAIEALREDGRKAKEAADAFKARGGSIAYRAGDAAAFDDAPSGHQVVAVCDPPYYLTQDYQQGTILGLDLVPDNWSYAATQGLLHRLADAGCAIVYTDEAWWNKKDYANAASDADMGGLFGSGILDEIAKSETFRKENDILLDIINTLDHFDVAGRVAGRQEVLGVHHGHERNDKGTEDGAGRDALRPEGADDAGGERGARPSVRRVAGDLEGEGRAAWGTRPHRGREGRVAIAREVIVQDIASSVEEASPASDPAAVDALVRHSVRSVREDRMAAYARAVRDDARHYAEAAKRTGELPIPPEMRGNASSSDVRFSVRANPRLREEVEAALNTDRSKGEVFKGGRRIVICDAPGIFSAIGIPDGTVYTKAYTLRKIAKEHSLTAEQIASTPALLERPVAVFDDNGDGFVFLTDAVAPDRNGEPAPVMVYVRPDGIGNYVASVYSRTAAAESKYVNLANARKVLYIDKKKVAHLPLRGEALSSLSTFSVGDGVATPNEGETTRIVPYHGHSAQGGEDRFSVRRAWANSAPMTAREIRRAVEMFGTTSDTKEAAYITPDGEWLNYEEMGEHFEIRQALSQKRNAQLDKLKIDEGDATPYVAAAIKGGLVRVTGGIFTLDGKPKELGVQFTGRPDAKTLDNVERFFDAVAEQYPDAQLTVEGDGWTRMYAPDESARLMLDLRNFAHTGETPPEPSVVSQFHTRYSVTTAWRHDFPKTVCMTTRAAIMEKHGDLFRKAKAGGVRAAAQLVKAVVKPDKIAALIADHPDASIVCPVYAEEETGRNKIPRAFAKYIAKVAGIETDQDIMQSVRAFHSGATAGHRLFVSPEFEGKVTPGAEYILVDDHITQGGTVNALRDHIEANGGKVVAIAALTLSQGSSILSPRKETLDEIKRKWPDIDGLLKSAGIAERADALTESQLRYILKFSTDTFRDRVAQAGREGGGQGAGRALRGREAASERTPSEGVAREETQAERERMRHSVRSWNSVGLANVATALFAQQLLAGKEVSAEEADNLLKNIGLGAIPAPELLKKAKELAEQNREKVQRLVRDNAPELVDALVQSGLEAQFRDALDGAITGAAEAADPSVGREVQKAVQRHETRELMAANGFDAAQMMAELPIDLTRGLLATADRVKTPEEIAKLEDARKRREEERAAAEAEMTDDERLAAVDDPTYVPPSKESLELFQQLYDSAKFALDARQAEERRAAAEKEKRKAEAAKEKAGTDEGSADAAPSASAKDDADALLPAETVARIAPVFDSPELFAQFLVEWTAKHVVERHPNIPSTAQMWKNPVAIRELKQTATGILRKLARDCLGSPSLNYARNFVDHQINELESDAETRTYKAVLRKVAYIYDAIHENALRLKRRELVNRLINGYRAKNPETGKMETVPGIRQLAGVKGRFSAVREEFQRAIDARTEVWARQLVPLLTMGEEKLASEIAEMERRLAADPTADDYVPMDDDARREMADRLALAKKYGGLVRRMPGEIADATDEILSDLNGRRQAFEQRRLERENEDMAMRDAIVEAMRAGSATDFRKPQGRLGRYADAMQGNLTLEMQNLVRFCRDPEKRQAALEAIETLQAWISEATGRYRVVLGEAQRELREGLAACYGSAENGIRHLLKDELDPETAAKIFKSRDKVPTYGQLLQLYASAIQSDYKENAEKHGRTAQLPLMEQTLTDSDKAFHAFAVEWYKRNRRALSDAVEAVTGLPVTSPDALYCPVRVQTEADGFSADAVAWSPVPAALNRRVRHGLDFNEGVNFLSVLQEQAEIRAQTIGYSAVGIRLRDILAHRETQKAARETVGKRDIKTVLDHVKDVLVQNAARKDESAFFAPLNLARKWIARFALAGNVPSAIKQLASMPVWANAMLGGHEIGLKRTMHYLATVGTDEGRAAIRDLVESDGFKARYTMGWSEETQNILMNPSKSRILRHVEKAYDKGMVVNKAVDAVSCLWMAQGFYRDARAHFLAKGLAPDEAKRMALAMTWSVLESGQQSGRIENMNRLQRKGGAGVAAIFQFKTAYILQNNYLIQAIKEWRAGTPGAMGRAIRAAFINCVWIPAFVQCVNLAWSALMGDEQPPEDPEKWPKWLKDFGWSMIDGVTAPMFGVSTAAHTAYDAITGNWSWGQSSGIPAIDSAIRVTGDAVRAAADLFKTVTCLDAEEELTSEKLQKDVWRLLKDIAAPVRHGKKMYDNRWGKDAR